MATPTLRTFFGIAIGDAARAEAHAVAQRLAGEPGGDAVRWVRPEAYHVTLRFLGRTQRERIPDIVEAARRALRSVPPFSARLGALAGFPSGRRAQVVVLEIEPGASLGALAAAVEVGAVEAGFEPESRVFRPHLTLGRLRARQRRAPLLDAVPGPSAPTPFAVDALALFQSVLAPGGSRYTPLEWIALGGPQSP